MKKTNDEWVKEFRNKFPYSGAIIEDDGTSYNFRDIEQFIQSQIDKARKEAIDQFAESVVPKENKLDKDLMWDKFSKSNIEEIQEAWSILGMNIGYNQAISDIKANIKGVKDEKM